VVQRVVQVGALTWAAVGLAVSLTSLRATNPDARVFVGVASVFGPTSAVLAASALAHHRVRTGGVLLILSIVTPTYFAWALSVPALIVGLALVVAPRKMVRAQALDGPDGPHLWRGRRCRSRGQGTGS
jgi:hypothetical protein